MSVQGSDKVGKEFKKEKKKERKKQVHLVYEQKRFAESSFTGSLQKSPGTESSSGGPEAWSRGR